MKLLTTIIRKKAEKIATKANSELLAHSYYLECDRFGHERELLYIEGINSMIARLEEIKKELTGGVK